MIKEYQLFIAPRKGHKIDKRIDVPRAAYFLRTKGGGYKTLKEAKENLNFHLKEGKKHWIGKIIDYPLPRYTPTGDYRSYRIA